MAQNTNGVIYLEIDEDITSAIDKLSGSTSDAVQIVTAKRSTLFQSVINLRLLKKAADENGKKLVLVTSDRVATNLAARIGVPVAERVGEPGRIPTAATAAHVVSDDEIDGGAIGEDEAPATKEPVAAPEPEPASDQAPAPKPEPVRKAAPAAAAAAAASSGKASKVPKPAIPNIGRMQKRFLWGIGALAAVLALFGLNYYFTTAKVSLFARGDQKIANFNFTADPAAQQSDVSSNVLSAQQVSVNKTLNGSVQATGTKDNGTKASGSMTVYNKTNNPQTLVAGTRFQAPDGKIFRSNNDVVVPQAYLVNFTPMAGTAKVNVTADQNGDSYNLGPSHYSIPALGGEQVYGEGGQMQGGTSKTVKVITQADVDKAKQAALDADKDDSLKSLSSKAGSNQVFLEASYQQNVTKVDSSPDVGGEAQNGTVVVQVTYTGLSVRKSELSELTRKEEQKQVGADQEIYEDGSDKLQLTASGKPDGEGAMKFQAKATAFAGSKIDKDALAKEIKGKKYGEAVNLASQQPDIEKAEISISPSWATSMPNITKHIHIEIKVSNQ